MTGMIDTLKSGGKWTMHHDDVPRGGKEWWTMDVEIDGADYAAVLCQGPYMVNAILGWKARAARVDKLEKALRKAQDRIYYAIDWRREGKDEPLKQAWREIEEALGDAAPSSEEGEDENRGFD